MMINRGSTTDRPGTNSRMVLKEGVLYQRIHFCENKLCVSGIISLTTLEHLEQCKSWMVDEGLEPTTYKALNKQLSARSINWHKVVQNSHAKRKFSKENKNEARAMERASISTNVV